MPMAYDPVARHKVIEKKAVRGELRKYYRFRTDRWYGGIATGDCVGCGLLCKFCWVRDSILFAPQKEGHFYNPHEVARKLLSKARKKAIKQLRLSGGEPTIGRSHLLLLLDNLRWKGHLFILETNGILIGSDKSYARDLAAFPFLHVRISIKGCDQDEFTMLTNSKPEGFELQLRALEYLFNAGVSCNPAVMTSFSSPKKLEKLRRRIFAMMPSLMEEFEEEELILYPQVSDRLNRFNLSYRTAFRPGDVPPETV
jgi:uncharacterized Fe-S cluster-containing radical SAM superfamily protein